MGEKFTVSKMYPVFITENIIKAVGKDRLNDTVFTAGKDKGRQTYTFNIYCNKGSFNDIEDMKEILLNATMKNKDLQSQAFWNKSRKGLILIQDYMDTARFTATLEDEYLKQPVFRVVLADEGLFNMTKRRIVSTLEDFGIRVGAVPPKDRILLNESIISQMGMGGDTSVGNTR